MIKQCKESLNWAAGICFYTKPAVFYTKSEKHNWYNKREVLYNIMIRTFSIAYFCQDKTLLII
ncbi:hypothetical protein EGY05_11915 [Chryseobacterium arthrosphaerae]|nr:hypothetical protein EGY05_11915 [Chryseobacterium arthrosphaerae]